MYYGQMLDLGYNISSSGEPATQKSKTLSTLQYLFELGSMSYLITYSEWILGFCQDGPTPPSHSQKGAKVESSRGPYKSAFSQEDLHEWSPLVTNQQQLFSVIDFTNYQEAK